MPRFLDSECVTYFRYLYCFSHSEITKESSFPVFQENETFLAKCSFTACMLLNVIRHANAKSAPLDFIDKKKNYRETQQTEHPLYTGPYLKQYLRSFVHFLYNRNRNNTHTIQLCSNIWHENGSYVIQLNIHLDLQKNSAFQLVFYWAMFTRYRLTQCGD